MATKFHGLTPILNVPDVPAAIGYFVEKLGFSLDWQWEDPATFASVSRDETCLFLCQGGQGDGAVWMSVWVEDVDALHEEYQASGAIIRQEPTDFEWGTREMNVATPDGHRLRFSSSAKSETTNRSIAE